MGQKDSVDTENGTMQLLITSSRSEERIIPTANWEVTPRRFLWESAIILHVKALELAWHFRDADEYVYCNSPTISTLGITIYYS